MASKLTLRYDREAARAAQPSTPGRVESLEVLFFSERLQSNELFELPVTADLQRSGEAENPREH